MLLFHEWLLNAEERGPRHHSQGERSLHRLDRLANLHEVKVLCMRIAVVHSFYSSERPSGENEMVLEQIRGLQSAGHQVQLFSRETDDAREERFYSARSAVRVLTGYGNNPLKDIDKYNPEIIHIHNTFPNFSDGWLNHVKAPIVATMHNYRAFCANGLLFRDGHVCFSCPDGDSMAAIRNACFHDSMLASIPLAIRNSRGVKGNRILSQASAVVCLSPASASIYEQYGVERSKIHIVPNGIDDPGSTRVSESNGKWLAIGRSSPEKGFAELMLSWPKGQLIDIIGVERDQCLTEYVPEGVSLLGLMPKSELVKVIPNYLGLVFPSLCFEMQPTVVLEAMASAIPVIAMQGNAGANLVLENGGGMTYTSNAELAQALNICESQRVVLGDQGRLAFDRSFNSSGWATRMTQLYEQISSIRQGL